MPRSHLTLSWEIRSQIRPTRARMVPVRTVQDAGMSHSPIAYVSPRSTRKSIGGTPARQLTVARIERALPMTITSASCRCLTRVRPEAAVLILRVVILYCNVRRPTCLPCFFCQIYPIHVSSFVLRFIWEHIHQRNLSDAIWFLLYHLANIRCMGNALTTCDNSPIYLTVYASI